jgi:hypothetical protein
VLTNKSSARVHRDRHSVSWSLMLFGEKLEAINLEIN